MPEWHDPTKRGLDRPSFLADLTFFFGTSQATQVSPLDRQSGTHPLKLTTT